ncbi:Imm43 family immunity protein [Pyxidicoccus xibeiensis]|uniref:Imm43 family immunity protein n=1 Tax=Pyxidicoccus xibeiensis TaxID=2906759 RepID=UPI0020A6E5F9|nr:DUF1629 domain-containing protein [Pyxidicoccus xibeiensis]MCP3143119.1 hypothetical protein [Pyxidicoccus xibeiensis]
MMRYWILDGGHNGGAYISGYPKSTIKNWRYHEGESLAKEFPKDAAVVFSSKWPERRKLYDFLDNAVTALIVSERVRRILEDLKAKDLEFLPVTVKDHKGAPVEARYFILNPLGGQDAIDMEKSQLVMSALDKEQIAHINKLVLQPKKIDKDAKLFRASRARTVIFVDDAVRKAFRKEGITGFWLYKAEGWDGLSMAEDED